MGGGARGNAPPVPVKTSYIKMAAIRSALYFMFPPDNPGFYAVKHPDINVDLGFI